MSNGDLRKTERAYLALVRARYAARAARTGEPLVVCRPPAELPQGIDRTGEGPVPARIDEMRAVAALALGTVAAYTGTDEAAQALVAAAADGEAEVRRAVAEALGYGAPQARQLPCTC